MGLDLGLYLVTGEEFSAGRSTVEVVTEAALGGVKTVQLREKGMPLSQLIELGKQVRDVTRKHGVTFLVNDRVDVALAVGADGVHLGQDDFPLDAARRLLGKKAVIGISVDTADEAAAAEKAGASYIGLGPIFATSTKSDTGPVVGPEGVRRVKERINVPLVAIGGITAENAAQVLEAGADSLAVLSALTTAPDIRATARKITSLF